MLSDIISVPTVVTISFILGMIVGSFANVCIFRIPAGLSIATPASRCPACLAPVRWYQNIPVLSYLLLRGRCGSCGIGISPRYPLVEALTGFVFALVAYSFGFAAATPVYWLFSGLLVVIAFIDLDHKIIPNVISIPGVVVGFACSFAIPWISATDSLLGILLGGGSLYLVAFVYQLLTGKEGMGMGDVKLLAMLGAFLGWKAVLPVIFFASFIGSLIGVPLMYFRGANSKLAIPFGPFLSIGALIYLFWGPALIHWYLSFYN